MLRVRPLLLSLVLATAFFLTSSRAQALPDHLVIYVWTSPLPLTIESVKITNGSIYQVQNSDDNLWGSVYLVLPVECSTLEVLARAPFGAVIEMRQSWDRSCMKVALPLVGAPYP